MKSLKSIYKFLLGLFYFFKFKISDANKIKKAQIIFFLPYYHTGGAEKVHLDIVKALKPQKCCVIFTHLSATKNFYNDYKAYAQIIELNDIKNKKSSILNKLLEKTIIKAVNNSKTIHSVFGCNTNYFYQLLPNIKTELQRIDLIHALNEDESRSEILANNSSFIDQRVCINLKAKQDLISIYNKYNIDSKLIDKLKIIENGVDVSVASVKGCSPKAVFRFGFIGRWSKEKRPELFLEIAKNIKCMFPDVEFVMAGTGMKSNLKQIKDAEVTFLGEITNQHKLNELYDSLTGVIITSEYEGFPMVFMESMIFGVVPFSTNVGGISQHITHLDNGILVSSVSHNQIINDFTKSIIDVIKNEKKLQDLALSAKQYAITNFSIEKFNTSYQDLFKRK